MTVEEFLQLLEFRMNEALKQCAKSPKFPPVGDGIIIHGLPLNTGPVEGVWWTLGDKNCRHLLKIKLTHKAFHAWKRGEFEKVLPRSEDAGWFDFDNESSEVTVRLRVR